MTDERAAYYEKLATFASVQPDQRKGIEAPTEESATPDDVVARLQSLQATPETQASVGVPTTDTPATPTQDTAQPELQAPATDDDAAAFEQQLKNYLGVSIEDVKWGMEYIRQQQQQTMHTKLQSDWGVDKAEYDTRLSLIKERFATLPPQLQASLDNPEGAKLIWSQIELEQLRASVKPTTPSITRSDVPKATRPLMFTKAELALLTDEQRRVLYPQIIYAYANGLVKE